MTRSVPALSARHTRPAARLHHLGGSVEEALGVDSVSRCGGSCADDQLPRWDVM